MKTLSVPDPTAASEIPHLMPGSSCSCLGQILGGAIAQGLCSEQCAAVAFLPSWEDK